MRDRVRWCRGLIAVGALACVALLSACDTAAESAAENATADTATSGGATDGTDGTDGTSATDGTADAGVEQPDVHGSTDAATDGLGEDTAAPDATEVGSDGDVVEPDTGGTTDATDGTTDATDGTTDATDGTTDATDGTTDATDGTTDATDGTDGTVDPCVVPPGGPTVRTVALPLGETLFLGGDDYLAFWPDGAPCEATLYSAPGGSAAAFAGATEHGDRRITPDLAGLYTVDVGGTRLEITVDGTPVTADTFLNYNYTPESPVLLVDADTLFVAAPTSSAVQAVTVTDSGATPSDLIPTGGWPTSLRKWGGMVLVAQTGRDTIGFLDVATRRIVDAIRVGNEPMGFEVYGDVALVALAEAHKVVKVDLLTRQVVDEVDVGREPRAMALDAATGRLFVASLISSNVHPHGKAQVDVPETVVKDVAIVDIATMKATFLPEVGTILRGIWLSADGTTLRVGVSDSNNLGAEIAADSHPHAHGLAQIDVTDDLVTPSDIVSLNLDTNVGSTGPAASPMTMALTPTGDQFLVTLSAGNAVLALDPTSLAEVARLPVGNDPRGLVFAHGRGWTYSWLDNALVGFDLPVAKGLAQPAVSITVGVDPTPLEVRQGQRMFNDATFSKNHDFSCNNCHIDGLTDGLVWNLLVDGDVNTLAFRNVGGTGPFLWGGQLPTLFDFSREVLKLVGADASGAEMELLTTYMQSVTAPPNPYAAPGGKLTALGLKGKELFDGAAACGACHSGPLFTNLSTVQGKTPNMQTDVPSLIGVYDTAPFGRKGQWDTLEAMTARAVEFTGAMLTPDELEALTQYLREIPGDSLYLNSATPLNGDNHVWAETPIELVFSQVLAPGQEGHFTMLLSQGLGSGTPVAGTWSLSGRVARFTPAQPLAVDTMYVIEVSEGVTAVLGQVLHEPLWLSFKTGTPPLVDVSGKWSGTITLTVPVSGSVGGELAFLQSKGGKVAGVILSTFDQAKVSHLEGVVSGTTLVLTPFTVDSVIGPVTLEKGIVELTDTDGDGYADVGAGTVSALSYTATFDVKRTSLPESN